MEEVTFCSSYSTVGNGRVRFVFPLFKMLYMYPKPREPLPNFTLWDKTIHSECCFLLNPVAPPPHPPSLSTPPPPPSTPTTPTNSLTYSDLHTEKQNKTELVFIGYGKVISVYVYVCWEIMLIYIYMWASALCTFYNNPAPLNGSMQFHYCTLVTREPEQTTLLFWSAACGVTPHGLHTADRR